MQNNTESANRIRCTGMPIAFLSSLFFSSALLLAAPLAAQSLDEDDAFMMMDEEMISIATGGLQPLSQAPAVATVITSRDIEAMGARNLDEVLETVPGLHVSYASLYLNPIYSIRGIRTDTNPHVLMLVNGVPLTNLYQGNRGSFSTLPIENVARVEVIRGPGSAVYGADAFSGVINVITKGAGEIDGTEVMGEIASFGTRRTALLHGQQFGKTALAFYLGYQQTDGDDGRMIEEDAQTPLDRSMDTTASLAPGPLDTRGKRLDIRLDAKRDHWQVRLWNWRLQDMGVGPGLAQALDPTGRVDFSNYLTDVTYDNPDFARDLGLRATLSYMDTSGKSRQRLFPAGTRLPIGSDGNINSAGSFVDFPDGFIGNPSIDEQHWRLDSSLFYTALQRHRLRLGMGASLGRFQASETKNFGPGVIDGSQPVVDGTLTDVTSTPYIFIGDQERQAYYLSLQDEWQLAPDWNLTAGVRYDNYSDFGDTVNPRLALVWQSLYNLTTKLLYGRAFRSPSFQELFNQNNPVAIGNEDLKPETIETFELAFDYQPTFDIHMTLNLFSYEIKDLIEFVMTGGEAVAGNVGHQKGRGLEWELAWDVSRFVDIRTNYAFQDARDAATDKAAAGVSRHQFYLRGDWRFASQWSIDGRFNWISARARPADDLRPAVGGYRTVDLFLRRTDIFGKGEIGFMVRNLLDQDRRESSPNAFFIPNDYHPLEGRSYSVTLKLHF
ncbi:MAG: TonB-dependent receptor [Gammaproteobacteria bacterium]|nr:TonB-dependent receptor [Gammaproteobacteria bacterium]